MAAAAETWHVEKKIPLATIVAIAVQTCAIVWWAATASAPQAERLVRLEEKLGVVQSSLTEIKALLNRPVEVSPPRR